MHGDQILSQRSATGPVRAIWTSTSVLLVLLDRWSDPGFVPEVCWCFELCPAWTDETSLEPCCWCWSVYSSWDIYQGLFDSGGPVWSSWPSLGAPSVLSDMYWGSWASIRALICAAEPAQSSRACNKALFILLKQCRALGLLSGFCATEQVQSIRASTRALFVPLNQC